MTAGIYRILNKKTGKFYIGSSVNIEKRWAQHRSNLNRSKHENIILQRSWTKHGADSFLFEILEIVEADQCGLLEREQHYLDVTKVYDPKIGYNIGRKSSGGDNLTSHPNREDIIQRMTKSINLRYANMTEAERLELSKKMTGENNPNFGNTWSDAAKKKASLQRLGTKMPPEFCAKMSDVNRKIWQNEEHRAKMREIRSGKANSFYGKHHSDETKEKLRIVRLGKQHKEVSKQKMSEASQNFYRSEAGQKFKDDLSQRMGGSNHFLYGVGHTEESKKKMSQTKKEKWANMSKEDMLALSNIKIVSANGNIYLGQKEAAQHLGISVCSLTFRCNSINPKWSEFFFLDKNSLSQEHIDRLIWN